MKKVPFHLNNSKLVTDLPNGFKILISPSYSEPTEKSATWVLTPFKLATLELKEIEHKCKKVHDKFKTLYFKIESPIAC